MRSNFRNKQNKGMSIEMFTDKRGAMIYLTLFLLLDLASSKVSDTVHCDVVIAGGTTSAFAAAIASASEGAKTCLLEPTDWFGGQITAAGLPAIDFAWHTVQDPIATVRVYALTNKDNITPNLWKGFQNLNETGACWVSIKCFPSKNFLDRALVPLAESVAQNLKVYTNSVPKRVSVNASSISSLTVIQRKPKTGVTCNGYDVRLSTDINDWYDPEDSSRWEKSILEFTGDVFIDGTDWGELLALSGAPYLQGVDESFDGDTSGTGLDTCGQSITYNFVEQYHLNDTYEPPNPYHVDHPEFYSLGGSTWDKVWTYRRILSTREAPSPGDLTVQNWGVGNDYPFGYLFLSKADAAKTVQEDRWVGGIDISVLDGAERHAFGWHYYFKAQNPTLKDKITLNSIALGTCHGLAKQPYLRDSRRSIGIDDFVIKISDLIGNATDLTGTPYFDRVAIGAYNVDIHPGLCKFPPHILSFMKSDKINKVLPYFIPFRALTNKKYLNLLVSGKLMAQSFLSNAATRLHPEEWSSGTAAGAIASFMSKNQVSNTLEILDLLPIVRPIVEKYTQTSWTMNGKLEPKSDNFGYRV
eukprot:TRINITY_DN6856_c0_g1_i2.p1 TRINITY_DN6856_c0_g1~~TRINITY_DN6856_c0_g1_i2.p1  ORF type:complete len:584 (+),score=79.27 TRINITY_DN6856_c0_g1_i2:45-1796(+)